MPAVTISSVTTTAAGYNLTDSTGFTTLTSDAGNGITCQVSAGSLILKNDTGSSMTFTVLTATNPQLQALGLATPPLSVVVAAGKTFIVPIAAILVVSGYITVECSAAGKVLILV